MYIIEGQACDLASMPRLAAPSHHKKKSSNEQQGVNHTQDKMSPTRDGVDLARRIKSTSSGRIRSVTAPSIPSSSSVERQQSFARSTWKASVKIKKQSPSASSVGSTGEKAKKKEQQGKELKEEAADLISLLAARVREMTNCVSSLETVIGSERENDRERLVQEIGVQVQNRLREIWN